MNPFSSFFDTPSPRGQNRLAWLIIILFIAFVSVVAQEKSLMADEAKHYKYGMNILNGDSDRFDDSKMPVSALNAEFLRNTMLWSALMRGASSR